MRQECPTNLGGWGMVFVLFATGSCMMWIPVIGWIAAPILFIMAIVMAIGVATGKKSVLTCSNCKHTWTVDKKASSGG